MKPIPYGRHFIDKNDIKAVIKSLKKDFITSGSTGKKFENEIKKFTGSKYALTCNSGTSALFLIFNSLNIKPGDNIIVPAINFIATNNLLKMLGANIFLADVNKNTGQIGYEEILTCIEKNKLKNIKAIVSMYLGGDPNNIGKLYLIKKKFNCLLIEDACHAFGSQYIYNNQTYKIGSCKHSDACAFSLHPLKSITSGEGGIVTTNIKRIYDNSLLYRSHGIIRSPNHYNYNIKKNGMNFRLSDINSALASSQLKKIDKFIDRRNKIRKLYDKLLSKNSHILKKIQNSDVQVSSCHLYQVQVDIKKIRISINTVIKKMFKKKIILQKHYIPVYKYTLYKKLYRKFLKNSEFFYKSTISLPIFFKLKNNEIKYISKSLAYILNKYSK